MAGSDTSKEDDELADAKEAADRAQEAHSKNYDAALEDFRFARVGQQWPEKIRIDREGEGRPCLTINKLPAFIRQVVNDARQNKPAITVHPVDSGADPDTAEVYNGLIRHIEQSSDADVAYDTALDHAVTGGFGYFGVNTRYTTDDSFEQDIVLEAKPNPFAILPDPDSTAADSADWNDAWEFEWLRKAAFERRFGKDAEAVSFDGGGDGGRKGGRADEEIKVAYRWLREQSVREIIALKPPVGGLDEGGMAAVKALLPETLIIDVAVYKEQKALFDSLGFTVIGQSREVPTFKVRQIVYSGAEVLLEKPWAGKFIPLIPVYGEDVNIEGERLLSGLVRPAIDPQRMHNYWRSTSTELVALAPKAPFIGRAGQFDSDAEKWASANTQSHAYIQYDGEPGEPPPQRQPFAGIPAGAIQEALNASDDMKSIMGIYDASLGARSNETSGRAIMARQREGDVGTFHYIDNLSRAIRHAGRILLDLIPQVYSTERVIRILGQDGKVETAKIVPKEQLPEAKAKAQEAAQQGQEIAPIYALDAGKYDLTVTAGPSFTSRREEAATQMTELIRAYPAAAPMIGDLLAKNLDWPGADEIAKRFEAMLPAQLQGESPEAQAAQAQMKQMAEIIGQLKGQLAAAKSGEALKARELDIKAYGEETKRLDVVAPYDPVQMAQVAMQSFIHILQSPDILAAAQGGADPAQLAQMLAARMAPQQPPQEPPLAA